MTLLDAWEARLRERMEQSWAHYVSDNEGMVEFWKLSRDARGDPCCVCREELERDRAHRRGQVVCSTGALEPARWHATFFYGLGEGVRSIDFKFCLRHATAAYAFVRAIALAEARVGGATFAAEGDVEDPGEPVEFWR